MNRFEKQFQEVLEQIENNDFTKAIKRLIDFTLDSEKIDFYQKTIQFLDWNETQTDEKLIKEKLQSLLQELHEVLSKKEEVVPESCIKISNIEKKYNSNFSLGPVNLNIKTGEIYGLVGENGNGKTTLLRSICGELAISNGKIEYLFDYKDLYDLRTKLVYIPQRTDTWYGSVLENLQFTASSYQYKSEEINLIIELLINRMGLRKYKSFEWKNLSSGYKMRFELVRMLLRKPKILLIDEPLANLDILAQQTVLDDFSAIAKSVFRPIAIVLSSQQLYEVEKTSDEVIFLKQGKQKNLNENKENLLIIEFESSMSLTELKRDLAGLEIVSIEQNGGTLIAKFPNSIELNDFLKTVIHKNIDLTYVRNITNSTRRFFVN